MAWRPGPQQAERGIDHEKGSGRRKQAGVDKKEEIL